MYAALTPDYFGEQQRVQLRAGVQREAGQQRLQPGTRVGVVSAWGYTGAYTMAGFVPFGSAILALFLKRPGRGNRVRNAAPATSNTAAGQAT